LNEVPVKNMKAFEETFLHEMDTKMPDMLQELKKGNLPEDGVAKMVALAQSLIPQFSK
jgi:F-type H+-transporting ATPase subunit alpha